MLLDGSKPVVLLFLLLYFQFPIHLDNMTDIHAEWSFIIAMAFDLYTPVVPAM